MDTDKSFADKFKLIIGLGNPGKKYQNTWHNAGFMFIDQFKSNTGEQFAIQNKKEYELVTFPKLKLQLLKPLTYMNNSGVVVADFLKQKDLDDDEILIVHDDLDIKLGEIKLQKGKFPKAHNGIKSIHEKTGKSDFWYLRIGIETRDEVQRQQISGEDYVLQKAPADLHKNWQKVYNTDTMKKLMLNNNNNNNISQ